jgi:hypothetical protein
VEVHSTWGTFEWLLHDAFEKRYRVGVVCHSDDHKGRPGATRPGASTFGAIGGLTCYFMPELTRDAIERNSQTLPPRRRTSSASMNSKPLPIAVTTAARRSSPAIKPESRLRFPNR